MVEVGPLEASRQRPRTTSAIAPRFQRVRSLAWYGKRKTQIEGLRTET